MNKAIIGISILSVVILIGGVSLMSRSSSTQVPLYQQCVTHGSSISMHIHPKLTIEIDGSSFPIPANVGISPSCMMVLHTHDGSGVIHVEYPIQQDFTLGNFFSNWGKNFSQNQIFEKSVGEGSTLSMTVDGQPNSDFENLILRDDQDIVIKYEEKKQTN